MCWALKIPFRSREKHHLASALAGIRPGVSQRARPLRPRCPPVPSVAGPGWRASILLSPALQPPSRTWNRNFCCSVTLKEPTGAKETEWRASKCVVVLECRAIGAGELRDGGKKAVGGEEGESISGSILGEGGVASK